jgi:hypothetical protein
MNPDQINQIVGAVAATVQSAASPATPGWRTSEFWLHLVSLVPMALGVALGASNPVTIGVGAAATLGAAVYTACRSNVKATGLAVAANAAQAAAAAITAQVKSETPAPGA